MKHSLETVFGTHMVQFPEEIQRAQKRLPDVHTYEGFFSLSTCSLYAIVEMLRKKWILWNILSTWKRSKTRLHKVMLYMLKNYTSIVDSRYSGQIGYQYGDSCIVVQLKFNRFLHLNEPPKRIFCYLVRHLDLRLSKVGNFQFSDSILESKTLLDLPENDFLT